MRSAKNPLPNRLTSIPSFLHRTAIPKDGFILYSTTAEVGHHLYHYCHTHITNYLTVGGTHVLESAIRDVSKKQSKNVQQMTLSRERT